MPRILFVHGMNHDFKSRAAFEKRYFSSLIRNLHARYPHRIASLPSEADCALLYWSDLVPSFDVWSRRMKGRAGLVERSAQEALRIVWHAFLRRLSFDARNVSRWWTPARRSVEQAVLYMDNVMELQDRVLERFALALDDDTRIVIGHSLGSVIAYQGLLRFPHRVHTLLTAGSPLGTPGIYEHLVPHAWPNVQSWQNVCAPADIWSVPNPRLAPLFRGPVADQRVEHGRFYDPRTHRLDRYLEHSAVLGAIVAGFDAAHCQRV